MFLLASRLDFILGLLLLPLLLITAALVKRPASRRSVGQLRRSVQVAVAAVCIAELLILARLTAIGIEAGHGWIFVRDRKLVSAVLVGLPAVAMAIWTLPALRRVGRSPGDRTTTVAPDVRKAAGTSALVLPPRLAAAGALAGFFEKFLPPDRPLLLNLLMYGVAAVGICALLGWRTRQWSRRLSEAGVGGWTAGRVLVRAGASTLVVGAVIGLSIIGARSSSLPETFSMMEGTADHGGEHTTGHDHDDPGGTSLTTLTGPRDGTPDRTFTLTAQEKQVRLSSGKTFTALTYNGQIPGPELRMREGELVEITLVNKLPKDSVTIHWHGLDVPNAEDGVAGVTQNAVQPGQRHVYRFRVEETGTRWYHSHQAAAEQVRRGLFGPLVIDPAVDARPVDADLTVMLQNWETPQGPVPAVNASDTLDRRRMAPGSKVRLRLANASTHAKTTTITGTSYRVTALDGTDLNGPTDITNARLVLGAANRYDVEFTMPSSPVRVATQDDPDGGILFSPDGQGDVRPTFDGLEFNPDSYGKPASLPFDAATEFDREFDVRLDDWLGFYDGKFALRQTVNGAVFPNTPMHIVTQGDTVKMRFTNRADEDHPMHLHGHHMVLLSRNGRTPSGSPIWLDTVNVRPGEVIEVAFKADNPGLWMDHCHNFLHTELGMVLHLAYANVTTPYLVGGDAGNHPS